MRKFIHSKGFRLFLKVFSVILCLSVVFSCFVFSSSADSTITNLLGTAWKLETFDCQSGLGKFDVTGFCGLNSPYVAKNMSALWVGYTSAYTAPDYAFAVVPNDTGIDLFETNTYPKRTFYVYFTGGNDLTNSALINFITSNGVQVDYPATPDPDPDPDPNPNPGTSLSNVISAGYYYAPGNPIFPSSTISQDITFISSGAGSYSSISVFPSSTGFSNISYGANVVTDGSSWADFGFRFIRVLSNTTVSAEFNSWFSSQYQSFSGSGSSGSYNSGYSQGYSDGRTAGFDQGLTSGYAAGELAGYDNGYNQGFSDGRDASDSQNLGQNLLGDTLSAPIRALNQFTLYTAPNGFAVTLGGVVGACISLTLFIAFLKIFAGG